jgi:hypothetical protein
MTTDGDDGTPAAPGGTGREAFRPRGAASYLEAAVDLLGPFASPEERASDRETMERFAARFFEYDHVVKHESRLRADVRLELRELAPAAERLLERLAKLSRPARQELENECQQDASLRRSVARTKPGADAPPEFGRLARLEDELAALAVLAEAAADDRVKSKGGSLNYETAIHGTPLRHLAFEAAGLIDAYRRGAYGLRPRPHLKVTGYPGGQVSRLTRAVAAHALGAEPEAGLKKVVERAVKDWRKERERELLWEVGRGDYLPGGAWRARADKAVEALLAETDGRIAARRGRLRRGP